MASKLRSEDSRFEGLITERAEFTRIIDNLRDDLPPGLGVTPQLAFDDCYIAIRRDKYVVDKPRLKRKLPTNRHHISKDRLYLGHR